MTALSRLPQLRLIHVALTGALLVLSLAACVGDEDGQTSSPPTLCEPKEGDCPNICDPGPQGEGATCADDSSCGCMLQCEPVETDATLVPSGDLCPNAHQGGDVGMAGLCEASSDCLCGLHCKAGICVPYEEVYEGCSCGTCGRCSAWPATARLAGSAPLSTTG
mgnify:CR=1 FL=1